MKAIRTGILSIVITFGAITALNAQNADKILGVYRALGVDTQIWSEVQFTKHGDCYEGNVIWVENKTDGNGNPLVDANNPDPKLRNQPANKIKVIWGVKYDPKKDMWTDGKVYNPSDGKTYDVQISFETPEKLKVRGYIGRPMLGRTFYWNRKK